MLQKLFKKKEPASERFLKELLKKDCDTKTLEKLLGKNEVNINHQDQNGDTFLHIALKTKKVKNVSWLLSQKIKTDITNKDNLTAFDIAVSHQNHRIAKTLLSTSKVNLNKKDNFGRTALQDSVILGDHEMAKILLEGGANINAKNNNNRNVIYDALAYGNSEFLEYLLSFKNVELNNLDTNKDSILTHKTVKENDDIAIMLIKNGADPTLINSDGKNFLCNYALKGIDALDVINTIIKCGFNINSKTANGHTVLMELIEKALILHKKEDEQERQSILALANALLNKGLDPNIVNNKGETALFHAIRFNDEQIVDLLLSYNIDVNIKNSKKQTPLSVAVYQGGKSFNIIQKLLKNNADSTVKNFKNKTLFESLNEILLHPQIDNTRYEQYLKILKEMLAYNQKDLNYLNSIGQPLFYRPLASNNITVFRMYVKAGLDLFKLNKNGHNLFFEYVVKVFEDNNPNIDFQSALSILVSSKLNHNMQDETGWTAVSKVIVTTPCNLNLFKTLIKVVKFDYTLSDKLGRTPMHSAVWKGRADIVKLINFVDPNIKETPDNYGILPIVYAALLGNQNLVSTFISIKSKSTIENSYISQAAINKFKPMLKNLSKLTVGVEDPLELRQIKKVIEDVQRDFA